MAEPREWWIGRTGYGFDKWLTKKHPDEETCRNVFIASDGQDACVEYIPVIELAAYRELEAKLEASMAETKNARWAKNFNAEAFQHARTRIIELEAQLAECDPLIPKGLMFPYVIKERDELKEQLSEAREQNRDNLKTIQEYARVIDSFKHSVPLSEVTPLLEALEFYAQSTKPDIESVFAKSAMEWGENVVTWEPLTDLGNKARQALDAFNAREGNGD